MLSFTVDWTSALDRVQLHAPLVVESNDPAAVAADPNVALVDVRRTATVRVSGETEEVDVVDPATATPARGLCALRGSLEDFHGPAVAVSETWVSDSGTGLGGKLPARIDGRSVTLRVVAVVSDAPDLYGDLLLPADLVPSSGGTGAQQTLFVVPSSDVPAAARALAALGEVRTADEWIDSVTAQTRKANNLGLVVLLGPAGLYAGIAIIN